MLKKFFLVASIFLTGCASMEIDKPLQCAIGGQTSDVISTGAGLSQGLVESNPLGADALLFVKPALVIWANSMAEPERTDTLRAVGYFGYGAGAFNVCTIAGGPMPVCVLVGITAAYLSTNICE
jgi:hypothetical protein